MIKDKLIKKKNNIIFIIILYFIYLFKKIIYKKMNKQDFQNLMDTTFKSSFLSNNLTKLFSKEISPEDFKKLVNQKKSEISSNNPSLTEDQKYQLLMLLKDEKETTSQPTSSTKVESTEKPDKTDLKKSVISSYSFYYIILLVSSLYLSILMTGFNIKLGKPALIANEPETTDGNFKILEDANEKNPDLELSSEAQDIKFNLNFKKHSLLIMPKMKKVIFPTFEGLLGFIIKYGLNIVNLTITLFGRFFNKDNIKWLKIRLCIIFTFLPIFRIYMLHKINNEFINNYGSQNLEFYKSKELFQYNPKNLPYNLYNEIAHSLFCIFLSLNQVSPFVVDAFYKSNNYIVQYIKKIFEVKSKLK